MVEEEKGQEGGGYIDHCKDGDVFPCGMHELHPCKDKLMYINKS